MINWGILNPHIPDIENRPLRVFLMCIMGIFCTPVFILQELFYRSTENPNYFFINSSVIVRFIVLAIKNSISDTDLSCSQIKEIDELRGQYKQ